MLRVACRNELIKDDRDVAVLYFHVCGASVYAIDYCFSKRKGVKMIRVIRSGKGDKVIRVVRVMTGDKGMIGHAALE